MKLGMLGTETELSKFKGNVYAHPRPQHLYFSLCYFRIRLVSLSSLVSLCNLLTVRKSISLIFPTWST